MRDGETVIVPARYLLWQSPAGVCGRSDEALTPAPGTESLLGQVGPKFS
jgi:hypothetical protein